MTIIIQICQQTEILIFSINKIEKIYVILWGDIVSIPLPGSESLGLSLLVILLIPTGIYFTVRTRCLPIRLFLDMVRSLTGKKQQNKTHPSARISKTFYW